MYGLQKFCTIKSSINSIAHEFFEVSRTRTFQAEKAEYKNFQVEIICIFKSRFVFNLLSAV